MRCCKYCQSEIPVKTGPRTCATCSADRDRAAHRDWNKRNAPLITKVCAEWEAKNKDRRRFLRRQARAETLKYYGGRCACCGEHRYEFLAIDHINGDGNQHRKELGGSRFDGWLRVNNYPTGYRVLCHNCNMSLGLHKMCPHDTELVQQRDAFVAALGAA